MRKTTRQRQIGATERITMTFTPAQREQMERMATARHWTFSRVAREALDRYFVQQAEETEPTAA